MIRINLDPDAAGTFSVDQNGPGKDGFYTAGPTCTILGSNWANHVQEEIANLVEAYGLTMDLAEYDQLTQIFGGARGHFGDGSDGDVTISIATSLTRDTYYENLTIDPGVELNAAGCRVFVRGTLTLGAGSVIKSDGGDGSGATAGLPALSKSLGGGGSGGVGGTGIGQAGGPGGNIGSGAMGGAGANGTAGNGGGAGGTAGTLTPPVNVAPRDVVSATQGAAMDWQASGSPDPIVFRGGSGGGGGGADSGGEDGGGGGGGGGICMVAACIVSTPAVGAQPEIRAQGGNGGNGVGFPPNLGGGGGGGGGGCAILVRRVVLGAVGVNVHADGGNGGTGNILAGDGASGTAITLTA